MKKSSAFYYSPIFLEHKPPDYHPENPLRLELLLASIKDDPDLNDFPFYEPQKATNSQVALNHDESYINKVKNLSGYGYLDPDTYFSPKSSEAAFYAVGAGISCIEDIASGKIKNGFCLVRPPGHHAEFNKAMGFCLFNNAAVASRYALTQKFKKVALIDFDVHHGNGTQDAFYNSDSVLYVSLHQYPFYPGTGSAEEAGRGKGKGLNINFPFPSGASNSDFKLAFDSIITPVLKQFSPELLIISAGYDGHKNDPLGGFALDEAGYAYICSALKKIGSKGTALFLEGGYEQNALISSALKTFRVLADIDEERIEIKEKPVYKSTVDNIHKIQKKYWRI